MLSQYKILVAANNGEPSLMYLFYYRQIINSGNIIKGNRIGPLPIDLDNHSGGNHYFENATIKDATLYADIHFFPWGIKWEKQIINHPDIVRFIVRDNKHSSYGDRISTGYAVESIDLLFETGIGQTPR